MISEIEFSALIASGVERNTIVFDINAPIGTLTKRLIYLLKITAKKMYNRKLTKIFIPTDLYTDFLTEDVYNGEFVNLGLLQSIRLWGMDIIGCSMLDNGLQSIAVIEFLSDGKSFMPYDYQSIVIGVDDEDFVLIGATNKDK